MRRVLQRSCAHALWRMTLRAATTMMMKISRSMDKRIFYIEVGVDGQTEDTIHSFAKDMKTRDIKLNDLQDLDAILNFVGQFHRQIVA